jgi:hypothetical protein
VKGQSAISYCLGFTGAVHSIISSAASGDGIFLVHKHETTHPSFWSSVCCRLYREQAFRKSVGVSPVCRRNADEK